MSWFACFWLFWDRILLYSPSWPPIHNCLYWDCRCAPPHLVWLVLLHRITNKLRYCFSMQPWLALYVDQAGLTVLGLKVCTLRPAGISFSSVINPLQLWCFILFVNCWTWFVSILLRIFASIFMRSVILKSFFFNTLSALGRSITQASK